MKVCVIGTGYVGLVTGICLAEIGHDVICVDKDQDKIKMLLEGKCPIYEEGLEELIEQNLKKKTLKFTRNPRVPGRKKTVRHICLPYRKKQENPNSRFKFSPDPCTIPVRPMDRPVQRTIIPYIPFSCALLQKILPPGRQAGFKIDYQFNPSWFTRRSIS